LEQLKLLLRTQEELHMDEPSALAGRVDPLNDWQIEEIRKGIEEADRGEFANDEEVRELVKAWTVRAR
jgi:predicted transcriptional regulator